MIKVKSVITWRIGDVTTWQLDLTGVYWVQIFIYELNTREFWQYRAIGLEYAREVFGIKYEIEKSYRCDKTKNRM